MFHRGWLAAAAAALVLWAAAAQGAPLEAYGKLPTLSNVIISPDGATLAYVKELDTKRVMVAQSIANRQVLGIINITDSKVRNLQWADNQTLILTTSVTALPRGLTGRRQEYMLAQSFNTQSKQQRALLDHVGNLKEDVEVMNVVAGVPQPRTIDGHTVIFVKGIYFPNNVGHLALFSIDLTANSTRIVSRQNDSRAEDWVVDDAGNIVAESSYDEEEQHWKLEIFRDGERTTVMDVPAPIESPSLEGLSEDGTAVIVSLPGNDGNPTYKQISLKDGTASAWAHAEVGFGGVITSLKTGRVTGGTRLTETNDYVFFDPHADRMWRSVKAAFKSATDVDLESWSDDRMKVVAHVFGTDYGEGYFLVDMTQHHASPVGPAYAGIDDVAPRRWIEYKAADGRVLHAYLTLPIGKDGKDAKNLPLIVMPHGGPHARDYPGFDWFSQALASRGYVVLQPQFRGSDGFGLDLLTAGYGEFGKKMQTDLSDGVRALAAQGMIDPKRVCIVGASYGGYAALAGATIDTGIYRCAVSIAGLSDIRAQLRYWRWPRNNVDARSDRFWDRFLAVGDPDDPKLKDISPIKHVDKVSIPILLIHGKDDTVVPYSQSDDMADELKDAKKPYEFVTLRHEDHWLSKSETRLQMLQATVKFLEANNPPDPPAPPTPVASAQ
ncbi:alpha/beta hydrolase family protein [Rhizomicrobium electricum]|uniref:S9 family peptidase n=1 Tax=Rhizomicrobium electricum TaxID=480070 RepID=A0ABP3Q287_9PROT|nr:S9 family peptidase [Rhizomicrobium electricum]NIJ49893.1 dipeptidyl aminopeptidase/acylaminoacyl peptidase [Rhizomicrobium electricum]